MKKIIIRVCGLIMLFWIVMFIKVEITTVFYKESFLEEYKQTHMLKEPQSVKVIKYSKYKAAIYYVSKEGGDLIIFKKENEKWIMDSWNTIWSKTGSADGFQFPYLFDKLLYQIK